MAKYVLIRPIMLMIILFSFGCSADRHAQDVNAATSDTKVTVGTVQKSIKVGMSGAEVVEVLGSPNIVTTDEQRREVWVYDKISTTSAYSTNSGGVNLLVLSFSANTGAASTTQRTLTVIIKYDNSGKVRDFAYHSSQF